MPEYSAAFWACALAAALTMGVAKAGFGGGIGIVATPLMALTVPVAEAAALLLPLLIACDVFAVWHYRSRFHRKSIQWLLPGSLVGIGAGAFFFGYFSANERVLEVGLGLLALLFVLYQAGRRLLLGALEGRHPGRVAGLVLGAFSGFTSTVAHAGAPPATMYLLPQKLPRDLFVGTTVIFFAALNLLKLPPYFALGLFTRGTLLTALALAPVGWAGVRLGIFLNGRFTDLWFNRVVYAVLVLTAAQLVLGDSLMALVFA